MGLKGGINLYAYVENNPLSRSDRLGMAPDDLALDETLTGIKPTAQTDTTVDLSALEITAQEKEIADCDVCRAWER